MKSANRDGHTHSADQEQAISKIGVSGRVLEMVVGPAGTGNLNAEDEPDVPVEAAAARGDGSPALLHNVVEVERTAIRLSPAAHLREIVVRAILDERFGAGTIRPTRAPPRARSGAPARDHRS